MPLLLDPAIEGACRSCGGSLRLAAADIAPVVSIQIASFKEKSAAQNVALFSLSGVLHHISKLRDCFGVANGQHIFQVLMGARNDVS